MNLHDLFAEFPRDAVSWRAQNVSVRDGKASALALAYIDARDVMDRLDAVCGPENWQDTYTETPKGRVICTLSIRINGEWIAKSDGAGDTDVEGEKGAISDALKRAAVKWGIGRYLYALSSPWVPCEVTTKGDKHYWKRWTADPWSFVKAAPAPVMPARPDAWQDTDAAALITEIDALKSGQSLMDLWARCNGDMTLKPLLLRADVIEAKERAKKRLMGTDPFTGRAA